MKTITLTSKGQITIPVEAQRMLGLKAADKLNVSVDKDKRTITLERPMTVEELAAKARTIPRKKVKPVMDVDAYYQAHRAEYIR